ncbi:hypothetical protein EON63_23815 [archaeon]|nr:MAG: hypothetical protein EON63_23815 [archaeon]
MSHTTNLRHLDTSYTIHIHIHNTIHHTPSQIYKNERAILHHKTTPHYNKWMAFKASGGVLSQTAQKIRLPISHTSPTWHTDIAGQGVGFLTGSVLGL